MIYTTVQGDMWDSIAYKTCGDVRYTNKLMSLNLQYADIFIFPAGIKLRIPEVEASADLAILPPWKRGNGHD